MAKTKQDASGAKARLVNQLQAPGFLTNKEKTSVTLTQQIEYLGVILNSRSMTAATTMIRRRDLRRIMK